jgi:hypothetical protein
MVGFVSIVTGRMGLIAAAAANPPAAFRKSRLDRPRLELYLLGIFHLSPNIRNRRRVFFAAMALGISYYRESK